MTRTVAALFSAAGATDASTKDASTADVSTTEASALQLRSGRRTTREQTWGYLAWWMPESWRNAQFMQLDRVLFFGLDVGADGAISERHGWPHRWSALRSAVTTNSRAPALDLTLTLFNEQQFAEVFTDESSTGRLLDSALALASDSAVSGLHIDFEVYGAVAALPLQRFRTFVVQLSRLLHALKPARTLSVFVPIGGNVQIYDRSALKSSDYVVLQGYDAHWHLSKHAGPVAPLEGAHAVTWRRALNQALELGVARQRLLLSYPLFAYEWPMADGNPRGLTQGAGKRTTLAPVDSTYLPLIRTNVRDRVQQHRSHQDAESGSMYYQFREHGQWHAGWYEGLWSLQRKAAFIEHEKLAGCVFFALGYDRGEMVSAQLQRRGAKRASVPLSARAPPL